MVNDNANQRGERIRNERLRLGLSQEDFAALFNKKKMTCFRYEKGERVMTLEDLELLAAAGVDVFYLVTGTRKITHDVSGDDFEILEMVKKVSAEQKLTLLTLIRNFVESFPKIKTAL